MLKKIAPPVALMRSHGKFSDIEQQCVCLCPDLLCETSFTFRYERKLQRSHSKESDDDEAAGPLPVITASGKVARVERPKAPAPAAVAAPLPSAPQVEELSSDQIYLKQLARAQDDFENKRCIIAESCGLIVEDPQQHFNRLPQMVALINDPDLKIAKLAVASLALLFKDIVPGYKIREIS
jgi:hypothetical protein